MIVTELAPERSQEIPGARSPEEVSAGLSGRLRRAAVVAVLLGPTVVAFFSGGYFDEPRLWAGLMSWALVLLAALGGAPAIRGRNAWVAVGSLSLLAIWSVISIAWAPVADSALASGQRVGLYAGALLAATMVLRTPGARRWVDPALATGALVVVGYGLSERLLPGVLHYARSLGASGRLEQPLTYWNAMGELAAIGFVLAARVAGDASRVRWMRAAAAAAAVPLCLGLYLSFSRGALFACAAGLVALIVAAPTRAQLRSIFVAVGVGALAALAGAQFSAVTSLAGAQGTRERQGALALVLLVVLVVAAAVLQWRLAAESVADDRVLSLPRRAPLIALVLVCAGLALAIIAGAKETSSAQLGSGATRLATLKSDRYDYWRVAMREFAREPIHGVGAGNWSTYWLQLRPYNVGAQDAHSLPIQTLAELGLVGLALLLAFLGAVALAVRRAHGQVPALAAGPIAGLVAYLAHAPLDWDWEMPAVTGVGLVLVGSVLAMAAGDEDPGASGPRRWRRAGRVTTRVRLALGALAILICAWFAVGLRQMYLQRQVERGFSPHAALTPARARADRTRLRAAEFLNPGQSVRNDLVILARRTGDRRLAIRLAEAGTRREPENYNTWLLLSYLINNHTSALYQQAQAHLRRLAPPVPASP